MSTLQAGKRIRSTRIVREPDESPDLSWLSQSDAEMGEGFEAQSAERLAAYNRGDWQMIGVYAEAEIIVAGVLQTVRTGGLWGIESDSAEDYFGEVAEDEKDALADILAELGFPADEIRNVRPVGR